MIVAPFKVVLDASVLYPFTLRDTLLRAAARDLYQLNWSEDILNETVGSLVRKGTISEAQANHLREQMEKSFPEAIVAGYEELISAMKNNEKDRHVVAAAVRIGAEVIVTSNLKHFRDLPEGIEAQSPDDFLCNLFDLDPDGMVELVEQQAAELSNPTRTFADLVKGLSKTAPTFARHVTEYRADR